MTNLISRNAAFSFAALLASVCMMSATPSQASALNALPADQISQTQSFIEVATSANASEDFVKRMAEEGTGFLADKGLSQSAKSEKFASLLNKNFDLDVIAKFSIGRYWNQMTPAQQREYISLFKKMVIGVYTRRFDEYTGQEVQVTGSTQLNDNETMVKSKIIQPDGSTPIGVDWRVSTKSGSPRIIDVLVAGVSMSVTQRSDFASVIQRGGGDVEVLLDHLRNK